MDEVSVPLSAGANEHDDSQHHSPAASPGLDAVDLSPVSDIRPQVDGQMDAPDSALLAGAGSKSFSDEVTEEHGGRQYMLPWLLATGLILGILAVAAGAFVSVALRWATPRHCQPAGACTWGAAGRPSKLGKPVVILVSSDGFRWGYNWKTETPNIDRLRAIGTEAEAGLIPVFPSVTFPNHYSIATGLYPGWHGVIANFFRDPHNRSDFFSMTSLDPKWWLGEPIWVTAAKQNVTAATYFWPGSTVRKAPWSCPPKLCMDYDGTVPYYQRVDTVLSWIDLPEELRPQLVTLYFEEPDHSGHQVGPDAPQIEAAVSRVDVTLGRLLDGLQSRGILDDVHIILLGDHGMLANCVGHEIYLEDLVPWLPSGFAESWVDNMYPLLAIRPPPGVNVADVYRGLKAGLTSGAVHNSHYLTVYLKDQFPHKYHYSGSDRIQPILGIAAEGYSVRWSKNQTGGTHSSCWGSHGYDNQLLSMRTVFIASGPRFARGRKVPAFYNIEVYNIMASILDLQPSPNNGTLGFPDSILLPMK